MFDKTTNIIIACVIMILTNSSIYLNYRKKNSFYGSLFSWLASCLLILLLYPAISLMPYSEWILSITLLMLVAQIVIIYLNKKRNDKEEKIRSLTNKKV